MKLIFVAKRALATYFVISALSGDMTKNGFSVRRNGAYRLSSTSPDFRPPHANHHPVGLHEIVDRGPFLEKLGIARHVALAACQLSQPSASLALVPTGTVLFVTTIDSRARCGASCSMTRHKLDRSAEPSEAGGVPTARKISCGVL